MARYRGIVEKLYQGEYWSNVYWIEAADLAAAGTVLGTIMSYERAITSTLVTFTKYRVDDNVPLTNNFITTISNLAGSRALTTDALPLWATARFDFSAGFGSPSRKYMRGVLQEGDMAGFGLIEAAAKTFLNTNYATPLTALAGYVDVDGEELTAGACAPNANIRQLRRGKKKAVTP